jgi:hypothetical protein
MDIHQGKIVACLLTPGPAGKPTRELKITALNWAGDKKVVKQLGKRAADRRHLATRATVNEQTHRTWLALAGA